MMDDIREQDENMGLSEEDYEESQMPEAAAAPEVPVKPLPKKVLLFYNPHAGSGMFKTNLDRIIAAFQAQRLIVVAVRADRNINIADFITGIREEEYVKIIAAGGDGTINIVCNAMMKADCHLPLAVYPAGTANDFAHYFNIPTDFEGMLKTSLTSEFAYADIGRCNDRYFVNVAAIGSVIDVSQKTDPTMKNALGILSYYLKALSELKSLKPVKIRIESEEYDFETSMYFMVVLNGNSAGGFRKLGVESSISDGQLDVIIFKEMKFMELPQLGIDVLQGKHNENRNVIYFQTPSLRISSDESISTDIDGELGVPLPLEISIVSHRLRIINGECPSQKKKQPLMLLPHDVFRSS